MQIQVLKAMAVVSLSALVGCGLVACMQGGAHQSAANLAAPIKGFGLYYMDEGQSAKLAYGQPNSDNVSLMLQCTKGSRTVEVTDAARSTGAPAFTLTSAGQSTRLPARVEDGESGSLLVAQTSSAAAPLSAFRRSGRLEVVNADARYGVAASADERAGVEQFFHACESRAA